jgi:hypothetical protein
MTCFNRLLLVSLMLINCFLCDLHSKLINVRVLQRDTSRGKQTVFCYEDEHTEFYTQKLVGPFRGIIENGLVARDIIDNLLDVIDFERSASLAQYRLVENMLNSFSRSYRGGTVSVLAETRWVPNPSTQRYIGFSDSLFNLTTILPEGFLFRNVDELRDWLGIYLSAMEIFSETDGVIRDRHLLRLSEMGSGFTLDALCKRIRDLQEYMRLLNKSPECLEIDSYFARQPRFHVRNIVLQLGELLGEENLKCFGGVANNELSIKSDENFAVGLQRLLEGFSSDAKARQTMLLGIDFCSQWFRKLISNFFEVGSRCLEYTVLYEVFRQDAPLVSMVFVGKEHGEVICELLRRCGFREIELRCELEDTNSTVQSKLDFLKESEVLRVSLSRESYVFTEMKKREMAVGSRVVLSSLGVDERYCSFGKKLSDHYLSVEFLDEYLH